MQRIYNTWLRFSFYFYHVPESFGSWHPLCLDINIKIGAKICFLYRQVPSFCNCHENFYILDQCCNSIEAVNSFVVLRVPVFFSIVLNFTLFCLCWGHSTLHDIFMTCYFTSLGSLVATAASFWSNISRCNLLLHLFPFQELVWFHSLLLYGWTTDFCHSGNFMNHSED